MPKALNLSYLPTDIHTDYPSASLDGHMDSPFYLLLSIHGHTMERIPMTWHISVSLSTPGLHWGSESAKRDSASIREMLLALAAPICYRWRRGEHTTRM